MYSIGGVKHKYILLHKDKTKENNTNGEPVDLLYLRELSKIFPWNRMCPRKLPNDGWPRPVLIPGNAD